MNRFGWSFVAMFAVLIVGKGAFTRIVDSAKAHEEGTVRLTSSSIAEVKRAPIAGELLARLRKYRGKMPADFKFDRVDANERR